jgi:hypothetical protein
MRLDSWDNAFLGQDLWKQLSAGVGFLVQRFFVKNCRTQKVFTSWSLEQHLTVFSAVLLSVFNPNRFEAAPNRAGAFVASRDAFSLGSNCSSRLFQRSLLVGGEEGPSNSESRCCDHVDSHSSRG